MDIFDREIKLLDRYNARTAAVLARLATGMTISATARDLRMSRSTVYQLLKDPAFKIALLEEIRHIVAHDVIAEKCHAFQRKILKAVIRAFSGNKTPAQGLKQFESYLDRIDQTSGIHEP
jgi:hypothetical protein